MSTRAYAPCADIVDTEAGGVARVGTTPGVSQAHDGTGITARTARRSGRRRRMCGGGGSCGSPPTVGMSQATATLARFPLVVPGRHGGRNVGGPMPESDPALNLTVLCGLVTRVPDVRILPSGSVVLGFDLRVTPPGGHAETVPVVWPDPPSRRAELAADQLVVVVGRVRRRFFRARGTTQSRTEVVAQRVQPARSAGRARTGRETGARGSPRRAPGRSLTCTSVAATPMGWWSRMVAASR